MKSDTITPIGPASKTLIKCIGEITSNTKLPVLDAGCGYGRNAVAFAARGLSVVCVDGERPRLNALVRLGPKHIADQKRPGRAVGRLYPLLADLAPDRWPFRDDCFGGIVCVHFLNLELFAAFNSSLVAGGFLYIETFGGQGGNYLDLPKAGRLRELLRHEFDVPLYRERKVGPASHDAVVVTAFARKRTTGKSPRQ